MDLQITNNREIKPQKVSVKQGDANTTVLRFIRDSYKYDQIDLLNYKAYAVTCLNGEIDMTELAVNVDGSKMTLTWRLSDNNLRHAGALAYQIVFKSNQDSTAVFNTYQGIIQISSSIDGDNYVSANYPTLLKQWLDLIDARSGYVDNKVVYASVGSDIPVEERNAGTLYYMWEEPHTSDARCATGKLYLGSCPYADSGLYIDGQHIYVDNSSETVFVTEPSVWVDTINRAGCGVTATDISRDGEIIILLTADWEGTYGNEITYDLGIAQYGAGAGKVNPSGGKTRGSHLSGGSDEEIGVDKPAGHFEDHHGNKLTRTDAELESYSMVPDYANAVTVTQNPYIAPSNGWLITKAGDNGYAKIEISSIVIDSNCNAGIQVVTAPVAKGD